MGQEWKQEISEEGTTASRPEMMGTGTSAVVVRNGEQCDWIWDIS